MSEITEAKNKKQLQKEMKEKEKQQKEREKKEKARRKQEEKERKKEEKAKQTQITGVIAADPMLPLKQSSSKLLNRPEAVTVAEPPSQISAFGQPIRIAFSTENAGQGSLSAYCKGARVGDVMTELVEKSKGLYCVQFTPIEADIYTLNVQWGGIEVSGSPFQINLSRFSLAPEEVVALEEKEEGVVELSEGAKQNELINQENEEENEKTQQMKSFEGTKLTNREKEEEEIDAKTPQTESSEGAKQSELIDQEKEELDAKTQQVEDDESFNVSGDPFDLAYNASRLLEKQKHTTAQTEVSYPDPDVAVQVKVSHPDPEFAAQTKLPHSEDSAVVAQTSSSQQSSYNQEPQAPPYSSQVPETVTEEIQHLKESNELGSLKKTNESMGEEIAELRQKMRDFESKLSTLEEYHQQSEEERKALMANMNVQGWLYKQGIKGPTATVWRRRYFRCNQGSKIYYYKSAEEGVPKGYIDLNKVLSVKKVEATEENQERVLFDVICEGRTFHMQADDEATVQQWMSAIMYLKNWREKNGTLLSGTYSM